MNKNKFIIVTGGTGRFAQSLKDTKSKYNFLYPSKSALDITNPSSIKNYLKKKKPYSVLHLAGLSRPMSVHNKNISKSINLNIIGTSNLVSVCSDLNIKIIYFSTSYVYPGKKGDYKETDAVLPWNNYAWSKLGGECAVKMYKNSLILRVCMTEEPFVHKEAFSNIKLNFIFHKDLAKILIKILNQKGTINIGGPTETVYNFAKKNNPKVKKILFNKKKPFIFALKPFMNLTKLKKLIKQ
jgi:dTDP-4-dehydrorhamnose reductase